MLWRSWGMFWFLSFVSSAWRPNSTQTSSSSNKTFSVKFVSVRVDTVDGTGSKRLKTSGRLEGGRLQFSVSLDCFEVDGELGTTFLTILWGETTHTKRLKRCWSWLSSQALLQTRQDCPSCGSTSTPRCAFKRSAKGMLATPALFGILNKFYVEMYLFCFPKSPTAIWKYMLQMRHVSKEVSRLHSMCSACITIEIHFANSLCTVLYFHAYPHSKDFRSLILFHNCTLFRNGTETVLY